MSLPNGRKNKIWIGANSYYHIVLCDNSKNYFYIYNSDKTEIGFCRYDENTHHFEFKIDHPDYYNINISVIDDSAAPQKINSTFTISGVISQFLNILDVITTNNNQDETMYLSVISPKSTLAHIIINHKTYNHKTKHLKTFMTSHAELGYNISNIAKYCFHNISTFGKNRSYKKSFTECNEHITTYYNKTTCFMYTLNGKEFIHSSLQESMHAISQVSDYLPNNFVIEKRLVVNNKLIKVYTLQTVLLYIFKMLLTNIISDISINIKRSNKDFNYNIWGSYFETISKDITNFIYNNITEMSINGCICVIYNNTDDIKMCHDSIAQTIPNHIVSPYSDEHLYLESLDHSIMLKLLNIETPIVYKMHTIYSKLSAHVLMRQLFSTMDIRHNPL